VKALKRAHDYQSQLQVEERARQAESQRTQQAINNAVSSLLEQEEWNKAREFAADPILYLKNHNIEQASRAHFDLLKDREAFSERVKHLSSHDQIVKLLKRKRLRI